MNQPPSATTRQRTTPTTAATTADEPALEVAGRARCQDDRTTIRASTSDPYVAGGSLGNGNLLVSVSGWSSTTVTLYGLRGACRPVRSFGDDGRVLLDFGDRHVAVHAITPLRRGGAALVGGSEGEWFAARIDDQGHLDPTFGRGGWTVLPPIDELSDAFGEAATAVAETGNGHLLIAGTRGPGCCVQTHMTVDLDPTSSGVVAQFTADGRLNEAFANDGRRFFGMASTSQVWVLPASGDQSTVVFEPYERGRLLTVGLDGAGYPRPLRAQHAVMAGYLGSGARTVAASARYAVAISTTGRVVEITDLEAERFEL